MPKKLKETKKELECGKKKGSTLRCQINKSTRLAFFEFFPRPTCLFGTTRLANFCLFGPLVLLFYEIYLKCPPYLFIWPYLFNWHLRVIWVLRSLDGLQADGELKNSSPGDLCIMPFVTEGSWLN